MNCRIIISWESEALAPFSGNTSRCKAEAPTTTLATNSPKTGGKSRNLDNYPPTLLAI